MDLDQPMPLTRQKTVWIDGESEPITKHYKIGKALGREGTYGCAYACTRISDNQEFAVKKISKSDLYRFANKSPQIRDKLLSCLRSEIEVMATLKHKYIVRLESVFEDKHTLWIVMERCRGGELLQKLEELQIDENRNFSECQASRVIKMMLDALNYMHEVHRVVHLDLKLENILFANNGNLMKNDSIKIIDFGMSQVLPRLTRLEQLCGTPFYTAPEVINGNYGHSADMWSVGSITFAMLFGFPAFHVPPDNNASDSGDDTVIFDAKLAAKMKREKLREERNKIYKLIKKGFNPKIKDGEGAWFPKHIPLSKEAYDFMARLMESDESKRMTAKEALVHPWIVKHNILIPAGNSNNSTNNTANKPNVSNVHKSNNNSGRKKKSLFRWPKFVFSKKCKSKSSKTTVKDDEKYDDCSSSDEDSSGKETEDTILTKELICMFANFAQSKGLKYGICSLVKEKYESMRPMHYRMVQNLFRKFDIRGNGVISLAEFEKVMLKDLTNANLNKKQINAIFAELDVQNRGYIGFDCFLNVAVHDYLVANDKRMQEVFSDFDSNNDGEIEIDDMFSQLKEHLGKSGYDDIYISSILFQLTLADMNNDGKIDYDEFINALHPNFNDIPEWFWNAKVNVITGNLSD